jgi:hypothetical protein
VRSPLRRFTNNIACTTPVPFRRSRIRYAGFAADFDRASAGFSPDRVDALVWALTNLLVEPMANSGIFELYHEQARQLAAANVKPVPKPVYAPGSVEYEKQQQEQRSS